MSLRPADYPISTSDPMNRRRFPLDDWRLVEKEIDTSDLGVAETLFALGNGYLGMRGNVEEGRETHAHGTFINGFHETWPIHHAEEAFGFARVGQTIVNVPDAKVIKLYVDDEPLLLPVADLVEYERSIDFREGVLRRDLIWRTPSGRQVKVCSKRMTSFAQRHLALMEFEVTVLDSDCPITISSQILNRQDGEDEYHVPSAAMGEGIDPRKAQPINRRVLESQLAVNEHDRVVLGFRCVDSKMTLAVAVQHEVETDCDYEVATEVEADSATIVFNVEAQANRPFKLTKWVSYHTSRGVPVRELADRCHRTLDRGLHEGASRQYADQEEWLAGFWERSDISISGQPLLQQALRWNLFQLAQASARAEGSGIAAKGVTGSGYGGHYFWDTEIYVLPFLTYTSPNAARAALRFRHQLLPAARTRAKQLSQNGALYPWRTINGEEASAYYAAGTAQYHIDADIAYALCHYVNATGDREFLAHEGIDILIETARMWADLGFWRTENGKGSFHIHGVTGPDEYTTVVNDNLYTNVMARFNLAHAARAVRELAASSPDAYERVVRTMNLKTDEVAEWDRCAEQMAIPYEEHLGIHPQDAHFLDREMWDLSKTPADKHPLLLHYHPLVIYRFQVLKQADVVLAMFLQGDHFTEEQKRANFAYYDPITTGDSTLSAVVQSIIAAEVGYHELALRYFHTALFVDLANVHGNTAEGVHVASTGGVWSALVHGFAGFRDHDGVFTFDPRLPKDWEHIAFRLTIRGTRMRVDLFQHAIEFTIEDGDRLRFSVRGIDYEAVKDDALRVPLENQGARLTDDPRSIFGTKRADGTVIEAIVPGQ